MPLGAAAAAGECLGLLLKFCHHDLLTTLEHTAADATISCKHNEFHCSDCIPIGFGRANSFEPFKH